MTKHELQNYVIDVLGLRKNPYNNNEITEMTKKELEKLIENSNRATLKECEKYNN